MHRLGTAPGCRLPPVISESGAEAAAATGAPETAQHPGVSVPVLAEPSSIPSSNRRIVSAFCSSRGTPESGSGMWVGPHSASLLSLAGGDASRPNSLSPGTVNLSATAGSPTMRATACSPSMRPFSLPLRENSSQQDAEHRRLSAPQQAAEFKFKKAASGRLQPVTHSPRHTADRAERVASMCERASSSAAFEPFMLDAHENTSAMMQSEDSITLPW